MANIYASLIAKEYRATHEYILTKVVADLTGYGRRGDPEPYDSRYTASGSYSVSAGLEGLPGTGL